MKVFMLATLVAWAAAAPTPPPAGVHRRSDTELSGTHYENKYQEAYAKYLQLTSQSASVTATAQRWLAIADANKDAADAWGYKDYHKQQWEDHIGERDQLFNDFLAPKHNTSSQKQAEYEAEQLAKDDLLTAYLTNHTKRKLSIEDEIAADKQAIAEFDANMTLIAGQVANQQAIRETHVARWNARKHQLTNELAAYESFQADIENQKAQLAIDQVAWNQTHDDEWANKSQVWHDNRDQEEIGLQANHSTGHQEWLEQKAKADLFNKKLFTREDLISHLTQYTDAGDGWGGAPIEDWDTSRITDMNHIFDGKTEFNEDISSWDTAAVTDMSWMFKSASRFNQPIGSWNTSAVTDMNMMFNSANNFNANINSWNTAAVEDMSKMFKAAYNFNADISSWNTAAVEDMGQMFRAAYKFNADISSWNTAVVTDMDKLFFRATIFDQNLTGWDVDSVVSSSNMFTNSPTPVDQQPTFV